MGDEREMGRAGKRKAPVAGGCSHQGGGEGNRTPDTGIFSPLLYQLSYPAKICALFQGLISISNSTGASTSKFIFLRFGPDSMLIREVSVHKRPNQRDLSTRNRKTDRRQRQRKQRRNAQIARDDIEHPGRELGRKRPGHRIVHPICRHKMSRCANALAHDRKRHPGTAQKRHEHAQQISRAVQQLLACTQIGQHEAGGKRRERQNECRQQRYSYTPGTDLCHSGCKPHDTHRARNEPYANGKHRCRRKHARRPLTLGKRGGFHAAHALRLVHARKH